MACLNPRTGFRSLVPNPSGKYPIIWDERNPNAGPVTRTRCGSCNGCRIDYSRQWAVRCLHEAQTHELNCFLTLTYNNEKLPAHGTLVKKDFQDFMKRFRKSSKHKIRYYHCGEYGEKFFRPHYHALIFGVDFLDKKPWKVLGGNQTWRSETLEKLWGHGFSMIGGVSFQSAAYVARYILKKVNGSRAQHWYDKVDEETGEVISLQPEYVTMSRRPGIGKEWFEKYWKDVYPSDFVVVNGQKLRPPRYYDAELEKLDPKLLEEMKLQREYAAEDHIQNNTPARLAVRRTVLDAKLKLLKRTFENET